MKRPSTTNPRPPKTIRIRDGRTDLYLPLAEVTILYKAGKLVWDTNRQCFVKKKGGIK